MEKYDKYFGMAIRVIEQFLALLIIISIITFIIINLVNFDFSDLHQNSTLVELISDALLIILGLEVVRLLVAPSVKATVELLVYVIARKALSPQATALDLLYNAVSFAIILFVTYLLFTNGKDKKLNLFTLGEKKKK